MTKRSNISIRPLTPAEQPFLWEMVYHALHVPEGAPPFPRDIVQKPEIRRYVEGFGRASDIGLVAVDEPEPGPIGAAWSRLLTGAERGYGYVDDMTPELTIAVLPEHRGRGVGTRLLMRLLSEAQTRYQAVSLSVSPENPAVRLYERLGFEVVETAGSSLTMVKRMSARP